VLTIETALETTWSALKVFECALLRAECRFDSALCADVRFETVASVTLRACETIEAALLAALATLSAFEAAVETIEAAFETTLIAEAACAEIADASLLVTDPAPPVSAEIRLDSALTTLWNPWMETAPVVRAETPLIALLSALCALVRLLSVAFAMESALLTTLAAFDAALATDIALLAALLTVSTRTDNPASPTETA
jgi:hypothetical protein